MTAKGPRPLGDWLSGKGPEGSALTRLAREADRRLELGEYLRSGLPEDLQARVLACNLRDDGTVVVTVPTPAWAARLRYEAEPLLRHCRRKFPAVARLRFRVETPV